MKFRSKCGGARWAARGEGDRAESERKWDEEGTKKGTKGEESRDLRRDRRPAWQEKAYFWSRGGPSGPTVPAAV